MASKFVNAIFGDYSKKEIKKITKIQQRVLDLEATYEAMDDEELKAQTELLKAELADGKTLDDILPEAFAVCREASWRVIGLKHFPVQILGGIILHQGRIAEMKTGEGKTLVATLPAYLNALSGNGVHIVTVNDYLAKRDSEWMGKVYRFLGLQVGLIVHAKDDAERREAYNADITYGTNNEMGFDYLRDNMVVYKEQKVQRGHNFAIVDEVDSILIDEARTPLIISGRGDKSTDLYYRANEFVKTLKMDKVAKIDEKEDIETVYDGDYVVDEKARSASLTQNGIAKAEKYFEIEDITTPDNITLRHHIDQAIKAHGVMTLDIDYVVEDNAVKIVDEFTGRIMEGRRYNEGLHQAIEAKEGVKVERESKTLATITFQNYFRLYEKLSGMTGTATTEAPEFDEIYRLDVVEIPTNKPCVRDDKPDLVFKTEEGKFKNVIQQIKECNEKGQPVLVGTISVDKSEVLSKVLKKEHIEHNVLNAKNHEKEAEIIAQAGKFGSVTISTNMAGRGTDIMLGGNSEFLAKQEMKKLKYKNYLINEATGFGDTDDEEILEAREKFKELEAKYKEITEKEADRVREVGGLMIIGTERHDARRIDNQLRGRAGRQGDPGASQFYLSTEDDIVRLFGGDRLKRVLTTLNQPDDEAIVSKFLTKTIENAQKTVESRNFATRKDTIKYDDVMNEQRKIIYKQRDMVLDEEVLSDIIDKWISDTVKDIVKACLADENPENWNVSELVGSYAFIELAEEEIKVDGTMTSDDVIDLIETKIHAVLDEKKEAYGDDLYHALERKVLLHNVDDLWMEHLDAMEELKKGIWLRSYAQRDPVVAFRMESYDMFNDMTQLVKESTVQDMVRVRVVHAADTERHQESSITSTSSSSTTSSHAPINRGKEVTVRKTRKIGANEPCPCGSGKKYKKCCGAPGAEPKFKPEDVSSEAPQE